VRNPKFGLSLNPRQVPRATWVDLNPPTDWYSSQIEPARAKHALWSDDDIILSTRYLRNSEEISWLQWNVSVCLPQGTFHLFFKARQNENYTKAEAEIEDIDFECAYSVTARRGAKEKESIRGALNLRHLRDLKHNHWQWIPVELQDTETKVNFVMESGGEVEVEFWSRDFAVHGFTFVLQK